MSLPLRAVTKRERLKEGEEEAAASLAAGTLQAEPQLLLAPPASPPPPAVRALTGSALRTAKA
jgi:hypothetical protein